MTNEAVVHWCLKDIIYGLLLPVFMKFPKSEMDLSQLERVCFVRTQMDEVAKMKGV